MIITYKYFSRNTEILPISEAVVPLGSIEYSYGFGVYESIRINKGRLYFLTEHAQRLLNSARQIDLEHNFTIEQIVQAAQALVAKNEVETANLKILLIGAPDPAAAKLYMICLNPVFVPRKAYKTGIACITHEYERQIPGAKTLNMLPSYLALRAARKAGAFDALLINSRGFITEGTHSNFFIIKDNSIISPPLTDILPGVTRANVIKVAKQIGFEVKEQNIKLDDLTESEGAFLTGTSFKILPIKTINDFAYPEITPAIRELMRAFDEFLEKNSGN